MGADLILTWADLPIQPEGDQPPDLEGNIALLLERIETATDDQLVSAYEEWQGEDPDEDEPWQNEMKARLKGAVTELLVDGSRDMTFALIHGRWMILAGGTSWGDSFEPMLALDVLLAAEVWGPGDGNHFAVKVSP